MGAVTWSDSARHGIYSLLFDPRPGQAAPPFLPRVRGFPTARGKALGARRAEGGGAGPEGSAVRDVRPRKRWGPGTARFPAGNRRSHDADEGKP